MALPLRGTIFDDHFDYFGWRIKYILYGRKCETDGIELSKEHEYQFGRDSKYIIYGPHFVLLLVKEAKFTRNSLFSLNERRKKRKRKIEKLLIAGGTNTNIQNRVKIIGVLCYISNEKVLLLCFCSCFTT